MAKKELKNNYFSPYLSDEDAAKLLNLGDEYFALQMETSPVGMDSRGKSRVGDVKLVIQDMLLYAIQNNQTVAFKILTSRKMLDNYPELINPQPIPTIVKDELLGTSRLGEPVEPEKPLHVAIEAGRIDMVRDLLALGADSKVKDDRGRTATEVASTLKSPLKEAMLECMSGDIQSKKTVKEQIMEGLDQLKECGPTYQKQIDEWLADTNVKEEMSLVGFLNALLITALEEHELSAIEIIMSDNFKPLIRSVLNYKDNMIGSVVLGVGVSCSQRYAQEYRKIIEQFLEAGADPNLKDSSVFWSYSDYTALHAAISIGSVWLVETILKHEPDLSIKSKKNETPLELAKRKLSQARKSGKDEKNSKKILEMVQKAMPSVELPKEEAIGAELTEKNPTMEGLDQLKECLPRYEKKIEQWLTETDTEEKMPLVGLLNSLLIDALKWGNFAAIKIIMSDNFKSIIKNILNYKHKAGHTALGAAILDSRNKPEQSLEVIKQFLEAGADPNLQDSSNAWVGANYTALHAAIAIGSVELVEAILKYNPNLTIRSKNQGKETPLESAQRMYNAAQAIHERVEEHKKIVELVQGAMPNVQKRKEEVMEDGVEGEINPIVEYSKIKRDGKWIPTFSIENLDDEYTVDEILEWFKEKGFEEPDVYKDGTKLVIEAKNNKKVSGERGSNDRSRAKYAKVTDVLDIFAENDLSLKAEAVQRLYEDYLDVEPFIQVANNQTASRPLLLVNSFEYALHNLDSDGYFEGKSVNPPETHVVRDAVYHIFNDKIASDKNGRFFGVNAQYFQAHLRMNNSTQTKLLDKIKGQFPVFSKRNTNINAARKLSEFVSSLDLNEDSIKLDTEHLPEGVKVALQNLFVYGAQLFSDRENLTEEDPKLVEKINALKTFLKSVLSQDELEVDTVKKLCEEFEQKDTNRGKNRYCIGTFFKNKRYHDTKGHSRLVKSTTGELVFDLKKAVEIEPRRESGMGGA